MTMSDRGVHPDLIEEETAAREQASQEAPQPTPSPRGRGGRARAAAPAEPPPAPVSESSEPATEPEPEWVAQWRDTKDPAEAFKLLLKNLPRDQLERDETLSGWVGAHSEKRAKELLRQQEREITERAKLEAAQNNDLYTLGEMTQRELQEQQAARQAANQSAAASGWAWDGIVKFQQSQPEELQRKVAGKTFGEGKGQAEGYAEYLQFWVEEATKLGVERELQRRESAVRKSVLSEVNGDEPVPERESGTPGRVREVTDEQISAMTLEEYNALFDENNRPKPGVRHRSTRGIPLTQR